jgi:hypothetical protein
VLVLVLVLVLAQVLRVLRVLRVLQATQAAQAQPQPFLVSPAAVVDCSQSTKMSQETLTLQITPIISSYALSSFLFDKPNC